MWWSRGCVLASMLGVEVAELDDGALGAERAGLADYLVGDLGRLTRSRRRARQAFHPIEATNAFRTMLPPVAGHAVVDLGCGDGQLSPELAATGAPSVLGIDPSRRMLSLARKNFRSPDPLPPGLRRGRHRASGQRRHRGQHPGATLRI